MQKVLEGEKMKIDKTPNINVNFMDLLNKLQKLRATRLNTGGLMVTHKDPIIKASTHNHSQKSSKPRRLMAKASRKINRGKQ